MTTIHYPAKSYDKLNRQQLLQVAYALEDTRDRALRRLEAIEGKSGADWADVREAARKAGMSPKTFIPGRVHWGRRTEHGLLEHEHGWVTVTRSAHRIMVDLTGPMNFDRGGPARTVSLIDPTPADVFIAARLVGLTGSET